VLVLAFIFAPFLSPQAPTWWSCAFNQIPYFWHAWRSEALGTLAQICYKTTP